MEISKGGVRKKAKKHRRSQEKRAERREAHFPKPISGLWRLEKMFTKVEVPHTNLEKEMAEEQVLLKFLKEEEKKKEQEKDEMVLSDSEEDENDANERCDESLKPLKIISHKQQVVDLAKQVVIHFQRCKIASEIILEIQKVLNEEVLH